MSQRLRVSLCLTLLWFASPAVFSAASEISDRAKIRTIESYNGFQVEESCVHVNGYKFIFRQFNLNGGSRTSLQVWRGGTKVLEKHAYGQFIFSLDRQAESFYLEPGQTVKIADLNGDGINDVIIQEWSGGAYCCYIYDIYSLGPTFKRIWHNDAGLGHLQVHTYPHALPELAVEDDSLCNSWGPMPGSHNPKPTVRLRWRSGKFHISGQSMRKSFAPDQLRSFASEPLTEKWSELFVDLVYSGNADKVPILLKSLTPSQQATTVKTFYDAFRKSHFYYEVVALNKPQSMVYLQRLASHAANTAPSTHSP